MFEYSSISPHGVAGTIFAGFVVYVIWRRPKPSPLMELAQGLKPGATTNPEVLKHIDETKLRLAAEKVKPSVEEELKLLDCTPSPRFACDDPTMVDYLNQHGYVVVKDCAGKTQVVAQRPFGLWKRVHNGIRAMQRAHGGTSLSLVPTLFCVHLQTAKTCPSSGRCSGTSSRRALPTPGPPRASRGAGSGVMRRRGATTA